MKGLKTMTSEITWHNSDFLHQQALQVLIIDLNFVVKFPSVQWIMKIKLKLWCLEESQTLPELLLSGLSISAKLFEICAFGEIPNNYQLVLIIEIFLWNIIILLWTSLHEHILISFYVEFCFFHVNWICQCGLWCIIMIFFHLL